MLTLGSRGRDSYNFLEEDLSAVRRWSLPAQLSVQTGMTGMTRSHEFRRALHGMGQKLAGKRLAAGLLAPPYSRVVNSKAVLKMYRHMRRSGHGG